MESPSPSYGRSYRGRLAGACRRPAVCTAPSRALCRSDPDPCPSNGPYYRAASGHPAVLKIARVKCLRSALRQERRYHDGGRDEESPLGRYCRSKVGTLPKIPTWVLRTLIHSSDRIPINQRSCRVCIACRSLSKGQSTQSGTLVQDPAFVGSCLALHSREVMSNLRCH